MAHLQFRRGTARQWSDYNPVLNAGEPGFETDTHQLKVGDGVQSWVDLPYIVVNSNRLIDRTKVVLAQTPPSPGAPGTIWIQRDAAPSIGGGGGTPPPPPPPVFFSGTVAFSDSGVLSANGSAALIALLPSGTLTPSETLLLNG